jgi:tubulin alpha
VLEVYNSVLATEMLMDLVDVTIMMDNEAMYNICKKELDLEYITYHNLN